MKLEDITSTCFEIILSMFDFLDLFVFTTQVCSTFVTRMGPLKNPNVWLKRRPFNDVILTSWLYVLPVNICSILCNLYNCSDMITSDRFWKTLLSFRIISSAVENESSFIPQKLFWIGSLISNRLVFVDFCENVFQMCLSWQSQFTKNWVNLLDWLFGKLWIHDNLITLIVKIKIWKSQNIKNVMKHFRNKKPQISYNNSVAFLHVVCASTSENFDFIQWFIMEKKYISRIKPKDFENYMLSVCQGGDVKTFKWFLRMTQERHIQLSKTFYLRVCAQAFQYARFSILKLNKTLSALFAQYYCQSKSKLLETQITSLKIAMETNDADVVENTIRQLNIPVKQILDQGALLARRRDSFDTYCYIANKYVFTRQTTTMLEQNQQQRHFLELLKRACDFLDINLVEWLLKRASKDLILYCVANQQSIITDHLIQNSLSILRLLLENGFTVEKKTLSPTVILACSGVNLKTNVTWMHNLLKENLTSTIMTIQIYEQEIAQFNIVDDTLCNIWWTIATRTNTETIKLEPTNNKLLQMFKYAANSYNYYWNHNLILFLHVVLFTILERHAEFAVFKQPIYTSLAKMEVCPLFENRFNSLYLVSKLEEIAKLQQRVQDVTRFNNGNVDFVF